MSLQIMFSFVDGGQLETIEVDATLKESHTMSAEITDYPVEQGPDINDNIRKKPTGLQLECIISDFPLANSGRSQSPSSSVPSMQRPPAPTPGTTRSKDVLSKLEKLQDSGIPVQIITGLKTYDVMGIESINVMRDKSIKNGLKIDIQLKTLIIVTSQTVLIQKAKEPKGKGKVVDGKKTPTEGDAPTVKKTSLIIKSFSGAVAKVKAVTGLGG